jgi:hypothetical protein
MKKLLTVATLALICCAFTQNVQAQAYQKGDKLLNVGIGVSGYGVPIGASLEFGVTDAISVGGMVDYTRYGSFGYNWNFIYVGARGSYHLGELLNTGEKFDPYAGLAVGYWSAKYSGSSYVTGYGNRVFLGIHAGARYYFKEKLGVFAEVGAGSGFLKAGLAVKF